MCLNSYLHLKNTCYQVQTLSSHRMTGHLTKGGGVEARDTTLFRKSED